MYTTRGIEDEFKTLLQEFKVVLVTGPRQVGKTTMIKHVLGDSYDYVALDDLDVLRRVSEDSSLFFREHVPPVVIDEVQRAPELFDRVKHLVDQVDDKGLVVLTGSQTYQLMSGVSESLAGRVGILEMDGISLRERFNLSQSGAYVPHQLDGRRDVPEGLDLWEVIHRGSMPALLDPTIRWRSYYASYVSSYIERDVRDIVNVRNSSRFYDFMVACAARTGQLFNATDIASTVGVDAKTVRAWASVLEASGIVRLLRPFWASTEKRLAKAPKLFFMDTGLASYLTAWTDAGVLRRGAAAGHMFETFVVGEVLKSFMNAGRDLRDVFFYRDAARREIDLVVRDGRTLHPIEVKTASNVTRADCASFGELAKFEGYELGFGAIVCQAEAPYLVTESVQAQPVWCL